MAPRATDSSVILTQSKWRAAGVCALIASGVMVWYAAAFGLLRTTLLHLAALVSQEAAESVRGASVVYCLVYWLVFVLLVLTALYVVVLDLRYTRLEYALEKREILAHTLDSKELRENMRHSPPGKE